MSIRLTGMASGLDTESMITDLMSAYNGTKQKKINDMTKYSWKMDAWSSMNTKIKNFYSKALSNLRFSSAYSTKKTTASDATKATVTASSKAVLGTQTLAIKQQAQAGYLTGGVLKKTNGTKADSNTTLSDLGYTGGSTSITVKGSEGSEPTQIKIDGNTKISDLVDKLGKSGVNANFDATNQRIFVSAKNSGADADFQLMGDSSDAISALSKLGLYTGAKTGSAEYATYQKWAGYNFNTLNDEGQIADEAARSVYDKELASRVASYKETIVNANDTIESLNKKNEDLKAQKLNGTLTDEDRAAIQSEIDKNNAEIASQNSIINDANAYVDENGEATDTLKSDTLAFLNEKVATANSALNNEFATQTGSDAPVRITGQNAQIYLNGAFFESSTNTFDINGLNINCTGITGLNDQARAEIAAGRKSEAELTAEDYNSITLTTGTDTDGIYKTVKNFIKEYNDLIKEMDSKYNADKATDYDILTDEQKSAMSEKEIEAWDNKIKDSLLRRDESLSSMIETMKRSMQGAYEINGKQYSLSSFGIETMSYFLAAANEKGVYHIDGDPDDNETSGNEDKLKAMIAADPDAVQEFFTKLTNDMYSTLSKKASSSANSSYGSFYDDKAMGTQYTKYKTALSDYEKKLADIEDKYYKQFSAMETALTKLQNSSSAITGLFNY